MIYLELLAGLLLLVAGGDCLVRGAVAIARRIGVSPLLIGLTLVGFGTSTPELITSVQAALLGSPGIAVGNAVGSNIANVLLILGVAALIQPVSTTPRAFRRDGSAVLLAALACVAIVLFGHLERLAGVGLVSLLVAYIAYTYLRERDDPLAARREAGASVIEPIPARLSLAVVLTLGGLVLTILGARLLVDGAIGLARSAGISETVVGLTIVALGTSLPELVTSVMAAVRNQSDVAFGNVLGSNIYNVLGILGVTAIVQPIPVPPEIVRLDIWVMLGATLLLLMFATTGWRVNRIEGATFLAGYVGYVGYLARAATTVA